MKISTRNLSLLPDVDSLKELLRSMAMLNAILSPAWEYRYYSFNSSWDVNGSMASMRDGQGDHFFANFNSYGCFLKGFVHDSAVARGSIDPQLHYDGIAPQFKSCILEPALCATDVTFCIWRLNTDRKWSHNSIFVYQADDPDGSEDLLSRLDGRPQTYQEWAKDYYGREVALASVQAIYQQQHLTSELIATLNSDLDFDQLREDACEIGYPLISNIS